MYLWGSLECVAVEESAAKSLVVWLGCNLVDSFSRLGSDVVAEFPCVGV